MTFWAKIFSSDNTSKKHNKVICSDMKHKILTWCWIAKQIFKTSLWIQTVSLQSLVLFIHKKYCRIENIRIYHLWVWGWDRKISPEASRGLPSDDSDHEGQIFRSHPHMKNGFLFLLTILKIPHLSFKKTHRSSWICWDASVTLT